MKGDAWRPLWIVASLACVLGLQLWFTKDRLGLPFLDTRLHYDYDNAEYSFRARNGTRNDDLRSQFGVTDNRYSRWGERNGAPTYYTDHPYLVKTAFQQYARLVGTAEWASRSFYLGVSAAIAIGLFVILLRGTRNVFASFAGAATLVCLPLFSVYQTSVKFEADGMLVSVWLFVALQSYLQKGSARSLWFLSALACAAVLSHWTAMLFIVAIGVYLAALALRRPEGPAKTALLVVTASSLVAGLVLICLMSYMHRSFHGARTVLQAAFQRRAEPIPMGEWGQRQWDYLNLNFTSAFPWLLAGLIAVTAFGWYRARARRDMSKPDTSGPTATLLPFLLCTLAVAVTWVLAFRQGSFIHVYWQYWLCLPIAALVAAALGPLRSAPERVAGAACTALLVLYLGRAAGASYASVRNDQLGTADDVTFLRSIRDDRFDRLLFVPLSDVPLNQWFHGTLFQYYTDRPVAVASTPSDVLPTDKVVLLRYKQRDQVVEQVSHWMGKTLANEKCGERMCAYDVLD